MASPEGLSFEELLANLNLSNSPPSSASQPRRESPPSTTPHSNSAAPSYQLQVNVTTTPVEWRRPNHAETPAPPLLSPARHSPTAPSTPRRPTIYEYQTPMGSRLTSSWATAGTATQGVPGGHVAVVQKGTPKKRGVKRAYVVSQGYVPGVFETWRETNDNVRGFSNAIYRGYASLAEAEAAFAYALDNCWVRGAGVNGGPVPFSPPTPLRSSTDPDPVNPLQGSEALDWQVVFRGINPGVYCSVLEAMLNTSGIRNAVYKGYDTKQEAFAAWDLARQRGEVTVTPAPSYYQIV
ncbi:hypothetical protein B0H14DRAFT_2594355 [Mycena olivaceomarginata]|nr:hypothetical protein B0H14DRAFT_3488518 [Mycena olivaceomarginata]KAJ7828909.1 hypothetical protein B0H14DRAFT_2594355 [Mycena olivaceomarginata]